MLKKLSIAPARPRRAKTHPFPIFVLARKNPQRTHGKEPALDGSGLGGCDSRYASGFFSHRASLDDLFEHPDKIRIDTPTGEPSLFLLFLCARFNWVQDKECLRDGITDMVESGLKIIKKFV